MLSFSFSDAPWRYYLRQEPDAVMPHVRIRAGGRPRGRFLPRHIGISDFILLASLRDMLGAIDFCLARESQVSPVRDGHYQRDKVSQRVEEIDS